MKRLYVCGDSFMSPRTTVPGTHFSEIFAEKLNFQLTVYSRSAISNGGIILQLEQVLIEKPDLLFFNITSHDRIEFPKNNIEMDYKLYLNHLNYQNYKTDLSTGTYQFDGNMMSDNLVSLLNDAAGYCERQNIKPEKMDAIKTYFNEIYVSSWKHQIDMMMMYCSLHRLHKSGIPYILIHDYLCIKNHLDLEWLEDKNNITEVIHNFIMQVDPKEPDPGYHTSPEMQVDIANFVIDHYNKYFKHDIEQ